MPETEVIARCAIYDKRPEVCRTYPTITHYTPPECGYYFTGEGRHGECDCNEGACCSIPREHGEPGGVPLPEEAGGSPCKHLVWVEREVEGEKEKTAASVYDGEQLLAEAIGHGH